jgi:hypothetical protein
MFATCKRNDANCVYMGLLCLLGRSGKHLAWWLVRILQMDELVVSVAAACLQSVISLLHPIGKSIGLTIITGVAIPLMRGSLQYAPP